MLSEDEKNKIKLGWLNAEFTLIYNKTHNGRPGEYSTQGPDIHAIALQCVFEDELKKSGDLELFTNQDENYYNYLTGINAKNFSGDNFLRERYRSGEETKYFKPKKLNSIKNYEEGYKKKFSCMIELYKKIN